MLGTTEIIIIAGVVLVLFGASAIPKFTRAIGKAKGEFEKGMKEARMEEEEEKARKEEEPKNKET
jgi:sec-independent protein translocase protein TatA